MGLMSKKGLVSHPTPKTEICGVPKLLRTQKRMKGEMVWDFVSIDKALVYCAGAAAFGAFGAFAAFAGASAFTAAAAAAGATASSSF